MASRKKTPTLNQRLEAIVETLEIVAAMQLAAEKRLDRFEAFTVANLVSHNKRLKRLENN